jgi:hypothetical protein
MKSHTGHRPFQCSICEQKFSEAATLQQHIRRHTQESKLFFSSPAFLLRLEFLYFLEPYVCDYPGCNKSFAITGALTIHKRTHNGIKPFRCSYCDKYAALDLRHCLPLTRKIEGVSQNPQIFPSMYVISFYCTMTSHPSVLFLAAHAYWRTTIYLSGTRMQQEFCTSGPTNSA